jgi:hypothetical protein
VPSSRRSRLLFASFAGGLWKEEGREFSVPTDGLLIADNLEYLRSGAIIGRRGRTKLNSSALAGPVNSLWRHYPRTGDSTTLAAVTDGSNSDFYQADGDSGTFAAVASDGTDIPGTRFYFAFWPAKGFTYLASLTSGLYFYRSSLSTVTSVSADAANEIDLTKLGPYLTIHKNRLFATHVDELNYSVYGSEVNFGNKFLSDSHLSVNDPQGGLITGLTSYVDYLLVLKEGSLWRFVGDIGTGITAQLARYSDTGCVAPDSVAVTDWGVLYVGKRGVFLTDCVDPNPPEMSLPIRSLWVSRDSEEVYGSAVGRWYPKKQQYVLKLDPADSDVYVLSRVEFLKENPFVNESSRVAWVWSHHTNLPMDCAAVWASETDDGRLITGDDSGFIHIYDSGSTDDGTAITTTLQTAGAPIDNLADRNQDLSARARSGRAVDCRVLHRADSVISGEVLYDQASPGAGASFTVGDTTLAQKWYRSVISDQTLFGRFVSIWLRNTASGPDFEVHAIDNRTMLLARRVWRDENDAVDGEDVVATQGNVTISNSDTEAIVTFATAQPNTDYEIAFGLYPSTTAIGPTTVGIKPGTKATTGFTIEVGGRPGTGNSYLVSWILSRASA